MPLPYKFPHPYHYRVGMQTHHTVSLKALRFKQNRQLQVRRSGKHVQRDNLRNAVPAFHPFLQINRRPVDGAEQMHGPPHPSTAAIRNDAVARALTRRIEHNRFIARPRPGKKRIKGRRRDRRGAEMRPYGRARSARRISRRVAAAFD